MRKDLRRIWNLLKRNWKGLVTFCVLFRFLSYAVFPMFYRFLFAQVLKISGLRYLTAENFLRFLKSPAVLLAILLIGTCLPVQLLTEDLGILYIICVIFTNFMGPVVLVRYYLQLFYAMPLMVLPLFIKKEENESRSNKC